MSVFVKIQYYTTYGGLLRTPKENGSIIRELESVEEGKDYEDEEADSPCVITEVSKEEYLEYYTKEIN